MTVLLEDSRRTLLRSQATRQRRQKVSIFTLSVLENSLRPHASCNILAYLLNVHCSLVCAIKVVVILALAHFDLTIDMSDAFAGAARQTKGDAKKEVNK